MSNDRESVRDETRETPEKVVRKAHLILWKWLENTGAIPKGSSWEWEAESIVKDAVEIGYAAGLGAARERERHLREAVQELHDDELEHKNSLPADGAIEERRCCAAAAGAYRRVLRLMDAPSTSREASEGEATARAGEG